MMGSSGERKRDIFFKVQVMPNKGVVKVSIPGHGSISSLTPIQNGPLRFVGSTNENLCCPDPSSDTVLALDEVGITRYGI